MSRLLGITVAVIALIFYLGTAESQPVAVKDDFGKGPQLGFDYRAVIDEHQALIIAGESAKAVEFLGSKGKLGKIGNEVFADDLKKKFSLIYGSFGKHDGSEIFGYKQISPRAVVFYVLSHYENNLLQYTYGFELWKGEWKLHGFGMLDNMDDMARSQPIERITVK